MTEKFAAATALGRATLAALWERTRLQGDMPGFAKAISAVLGAMRGDGDPEFNMTQTVLSDPVLTQKVLRLANSGMYAAFGGHVNTVSKAVLVLGTEAIGHLALGLKLIEQLSAGAPGAGGARIEMEKALLAGMVAQQVGACARTRHAEEAVVCAMLHTLGRMMLSFYLPARWSALQERAGEGREDAAAHAVLGLSLEEVGCAAAMHWGLPKNLIGGMRALEPAAPDVAVDPADWVAGLATMAARCAGWLWYDDERSVAEVTRLTGSYAGMLGMAPATIQAAVAQARAEAAAELSIAPLSKPAARRAAQLARTRQRATGNRILLSGLADMRDLAATASPGQMISIALETVYQGLDFSRAVAFVRNGRERRYVAAMGFGKGVRELLRKMHFEDSCEPDVFHAALNSDRLIFIENAGERQFAARLPLWWKDSLSEARSFVILPFQADGRAAGFIYGDWDTSFPPIELSQAEFCLLNDLRRLIVKSAQPNRRAPGASRAA